MSTTRDKFLSGSGMRHAGRAAQVLLFGASHSRFHVIRDQFHGRDRQVTSKKGVSCWEKMRMTPNPTLP
jgi:hypothetical protein